ncbi:hypothetical protein PV10_05158 [Exophiala mesophila]|uniref:Nudix hydrolase domain-containing protein n=1 Tax=Exophiala mesophila TaxID=212818 RepID=A0A0D1ZH93_EXOME|nr:uncharacterized protein PV10_05158 [Exophiala mesophila]KIV93992.1 hypothetical protein PV10_05158 [Exophiala mesophila]
MQLEDWLDDLCVRFIINLPPEELTSVERICFQVEEAQWFYEDFIRPLDPSLPSLTLRTFSLRIFQHCPLFSQWSAQHHTTAFAEFMAYKSRVPVRGAIMLNEAMDEVVLVKGWKKSANWSFPRGKINKDENDLDCAVREVYEETGFDIRAAGLVKDEKDMKYIEVTMREQHMRLYVFRGVPRDTVFEPKTRKEISKIEWYKLTDLPTLKKSRQQDGSGTDQPPLAANKFYMVAPFLNPLKKWITQQRKKENRYSSHLSAPPMVPEETYASDNYDAGNQGALLANQGTGAVSELPEVTIPLGPDPSAHLKEMLNIGRLGASQPDALPQPSHLQRVDTAKSNDLLALLRGPPASSRPEIPQTPFEQVSLEAQAQRSPHVSHIRTEVLDHSQPPPMFQLPIYQDRTIQAVQPRAPYQQTGDPQFARLESSQQERRMIPDASALPKLTSHTKALLDVFKGANKPPPPPLAASKQSLLNSFFGSTSNAQPPQSSQYQPTKTPDHDSPNSATLQQSREGQPAPFAAEETRARQPSNDYGSRQLPLSNMEVKKPENALKASLLDLFQPASNSKAMQTSSNILPAAVELAATTSEGGKRKDDLLLTLLKHGKSGAPGAAAIQRPSPREGETAATISGPLNQPEFDIISRSARHGSQELGRNPLTSNRTLFDPSQPTPIKILTRSEESRQSAPHSTRTSKLPSKRMPREKSVPKETSKPFQPQILRRPQTTETSPEVQARVAGEEVVSSGQISKVASTESLTVGGRTLATGDQKQTLLSLFGSTAEETPRAAAQHQGYGVVSPLSVSQLVSPGAEMSLSGIGPVSTRTSRVGSMASMTSGPGTGRNGNEKRQTGAENKAFLLGYLGRIASQDS